MKEHKEHLAAVVAGSVLLVGVLSSLGVATISGNAAANVLVDIGSIGPMILQIFIFIVLFSLTIFLGKTFLFHHMRNNDIDGIIDKYLK